MDATLIRARPQRTPRCGRVSLPLLVAPLLLVAVSSFAQDAPTPAALRQRENETTEDTRGDRTAGRTAKFLFGAAAGLGLHESSHVLFDGLFGVRPTLKKVDFGGIPFLAVTHPAGLPPRKEFTIASAGFWMQHLSSEIILTRHARLRDERAPARKGLLAFNVLASVAYGTAAMAKAGPVERDTRAMASTLGVNEAWAGGLVLAPAGLDAWRYFHPEARWAKWISRGVKIGLVLLVVR
jgi:hypothetical protein